MRGRTCFDTSGFSGWLRTLPGGGGDAENPRRCCSNPTTPGLLIAAPLANIGCLARHLGNRGAILFSDAGFSRDVVLYQTLAEGGLGKTDVGW